jgi:predicted transposase/invertase (TIGR01784 family)
MNLLDPKLDVVFKLLFANEKNRNILIALLTAVLQPSAPIDAAEVLNPEVPKELPAEKGAVLDIHVRLADGRHIDVEMQAQVHPGFRQRVLYYWARLYGAQLLRGDHYTKLCPAVCVVITNEPVLPLARAHSKFRVLEIETHHELTHELEIHLVELPKIDLEPRHSGLRNWMQFLLVHSEDELEELAMSNPDIRSAANALKALSEDPAAQELARQRELAQINLKIMHQFAVAEGEAKGRAEGRAEGEATLLVQLLGRKFGPVAAEIQARVQLASGQEVEQWAARMLGAKSLAEVFAKEAGDERP